MIDHKTLENETKKLIGQIGQNPTIIVGFSGGPDSVFLLHLLKKLRDAGHCTIIAAHLNHGWRAEAEQDVAWCKAWCKQFDIAFVTAHGNDFPIDKKYDGSAEAVGRKKRRLFFARVMQQYNAQAIALGHHHDDQLETFFIRLARGSSLSGLHGMVTYDGTFLRPLLGISKQEILAYLAKHTIAYLTDATNEQNTYLRNRLRQYLVPALNQCDKRFTKSIINTMAQLKAEDHFLDELTQQAFHELFTKETSASLPAFLALHPVLQRRVVLHWLITDRVAFTPSAGLIEEIIRCLHHPNDATHSISTTHRLVKKKGRIWLENTVG